MQHLKIFFVSFYGKTHFKYQRRNPLSYENTILNTHCFWANLKLHHRSNQPSITIYFERNSAELSEEALSELSDFVEAFGLRPLANIRISGHTDADGSEAYNRTLSLERTSSVKGLYPTKSTPARCGNPKWIWGICAHCR